MNNYIPKPIDTTDVELPRDLNTLMEELSRSNHDIWSILKMKQGWTYGPNLNEGEKLHPDLVAYEDLTEDVKNYDRNTSSETLKSIYKLGFAITKRTAGKVMVVGEYSDDDIESFKSEAAKNELNITVFKDWNSAKAVLERDLTKWNSIVLDTIAKLQSNEEATNFFLRNVLDDLTAMFSRNRNEIPWFIMPNVYDEFTDALIMYTVGRERSKKGWGECLYKKESQISSLFYDIAELLPNTRNYRIQCVYDEVFEVLDRLYPAKVKTYITSILLPLHYPEIYYSFDPEVYLNSLRKILESTFKVCCKYGMIPREICYKEDGTVNLAFSCNYLTKGKPYKNYDGVVPVIAKGPIGSMINSILQIANEGSHTGKEYKTAGLYFSVMAYSLQLCDVIKWVGKYIKEHR